MGEAIRASQLGLGARHEHDAEAVGVFESDPVGHPIRVRRLDGLAADTRNDLVHGLVVTEVEDEQRLRVRRWRRMIAAGRQLEVGFRGREGEENAVVAAVALEATDLREAEPVTVKADDLVEPLGVPGEPDLHGASQPRKTVVAPSAEPLS